MSFRTPTKFVDQKVATCLLQFCSATQRKGYLQLSAQPARSHGSLLLERTLGTWLLSALLSGFGIFVEKDAVSISSYLTRARPIYFFTYLFIYLFIYYHLMATTICVKYEGKKSIKKR